MRIPSSLKPNPSPSTSSKFVDLAPTSNSDKDGTYFEALEYATRNPNVFNIALTGPYGSGKSSVIKSFLTKYQKPSLQISLAAFLPEADLHKGKVDKQEIERSILQQMLYGPGADKLPNSRFKRIRSPNSWSFLLPPFVIAGAVSFWYLLSHQVDILSGNFFSPFSTSNWVNLTAFAISLIFLWGIVRQIYLSSFGLSLKGISLKDIEITTADANKESILNRHLDEIIYFFQSTDYELVIIEDLDRFQNPDIFVTLREINSLINANSGIKRQVRFLYALRDDMFINTDRTKFFEFIIPVVPIINHSNSIDKVLEQGQRLDLIDELDRQFLREVSRYLSDLRLIRNVFNEYALYAANLKVVSSDGLDPNKLLALLIYKNVLPQDFEALHQQKGMLADLFALYDRFIEELEAAHKAQIANIEAEIQDAKQQIPRDVNELRKIYAMAIIEHLPQGRNFIRFDNTTMPLAKLASNPSLEKLIFQNTIQSSPQSNGGWYNDAIGDIERAVDPRKTFAQRVETIERKSAEGIEDAEQRIGALRSDLARVRVKKFKELVRSNSGLAVEAFDAFGENEDLMRFLIYEGHIDDTYYQYISLFHLGRLSPNDNRFLIKIRSFSNPDPDFQIDNPSEIAAAMRDEDFGQPYVLNRHLMNYFLTEPREHEARINKAITYIAQNFDTAASFFDDYYEQGSEVPNLITSLIRKWPDFPARSTKDSKASKHAARILAYAAISELEQLEYEAPSLGAYISASTDEVLNEGVPFEPHRLDAIGVTVEDFPSIARHSKFAEHVWQNGLYQITVANLDFVFNRFIATGAPASLSTQHFTCVLEADDAAMLSGINQDFGAYVRTVLLDIETNTEEDPRAILTALAHNEVETEVLEELWRHQTRQIEDLNAVPVRFHRFALEYQRIEPSWGSCLAFLASEAYDVEVFTDYLRDESVMASLFREGMPAADSEKPLWSFLLNNEAFDDNTYRAYIGNLPRTFSQFPENVSAEKRQILIEAGTISFTASSLGALADDDALQALFVANHISHYLSTPDNYDISESVRIRLLEANISDEDKRVLADTIAETTISGDTSVAALIAPVLDRTKFDSAKYDATTLQAMILQAKAVSVQISMFTKSLARFDDAETRSVLEQLGVPYSEIARFGKFPKIPNTRINLAFIEALKERDFISSFKISYTERDIRIYTFKN